MANLRKAAARFLAKARKPVAAPAETTAPANAISPAADAAPGPSPNPMTNLVLADIALRGGGALLRRAVEASLLGQAVGAGKAKKIIKGRTMGQTLVGTALARIATRSVPGAIVIGGGMLAKTLYDRRREKQAAKDGAKAIDEQAKRGGS